MTKPVAPEEPDVAEVAGRLPETRRRAVMALSDVWQTAPKGVSRQSIAALPSLLCERGWPRGRIATSTPVEYRLTPLGLAVRAYLLSPEPSSRIP